MDTTKFELSKEEVRQIIYRHPTPGDLARQEDKYNAEQFVTFGKTSLSALLQAQAEKVFSLFEPVELELLGDEEMINAIGLNPNKAYWSKEDWDTQITREMRIVSQATINKNQKGKLYRIKD